MIRLPRWLLLLLLFPLVDLALLVWIGVSFSGEAVIILVLASAMIGSLAVQRSGGHFRESLEAMVRDKEVGYRLMDHVAVLAAGVLLVLPGPVGDLIGLLLLIPIVRRLVMLGVARRIAKSFRGPETTGGSEARVAQREPPAARHVDVRIIDVEHRPAEGRGE